MERLTMTNEELNEIRQCYSDFNCPVKAEEDSITQNFCDRACDEFQEKCPFKNVGLKLKNYEDVEEQGLLLRLPCKVGSELYVIRKLCDGKETRVIENVIANSFDLRALQRFVITSNGHRLNFSNFGKTVFLTKEEAEQALAEMKGDSDA